MPLFILDIVIEISKHLNLESQIHLSKTCKLFHTSLSTIISKRKKIALRIGRKWRSLIIYKFPKRYRGLLYDPRYPFPRNILFICNIQLPNYYINLVRYYDTPINKYLVHLYGQELVIYHIPFAINYSICMNYNAILTNERIKNAILQHDNIINERIFKIFQKMSKDLWWCPLVHSYNFPTTLEEYKSRCMQMLNLTE